MTYRGAQVQIGSGDVGIGVEPLSKLVAVLMLVLALAAVQYARPLPAPALDDMRADTTRIPGPTPELTWPSEGSAAVSVSGLGLLGSSGRPKRPLPIASVAKVMTALVVLDEKPLKLGEKGPPIPVQAEDVAAYESAEKAGESAVAVSAGEQLAEYEALQGLLIPSGNNIALLLARWVAGSEEKMVRKMNAKAAALGLEDTSFADVSGLSPQTTSIPTDLISLGETAMGNPVIEEIVAQPEAELPVAGRVFNVNYALGENGIVGIKTGSSSQARSNLLFAADHTIDGRTARIVGAVMGQLSLEEAFRSSKALIDSARSGLRRHQVLTPDRPVARYLTRWGSRTAVLPTRGLDLLVWPGMKVGSRTELREAKAPLAAGSKVGHIRVTVGEANFRIPLRTAGPLGLPGRGWRLIRAGPAPGGAPQPDHHAGVPRRLIGRQGGAISVLRGGQETLPVATCHLEVLVMA